MKKVYDFLKYVIYASLYFIILKTGFDFFNYKKHPDVYVAFNSAPWYTEALLWGALSFGVIIVCVILRKIIFKKMMKNAKIVCSKRDGKT